MTTQTPFVSVSEYTTIELSFEQDLALYTRAGIRGIELCEEKLSQDPGIRSGQFARLRESGLRVTSVQPKILSLFPHKWSTSDEPRNPEPRMRAFRDTIDLVAEHLPGQDIPLVTGGGMARGMNMREAYQAAIDLYPGVADYAADRGLRMMFEPLSPMLMNAFSFISSLHEAEQLVDRIDRGNFGICLDSWHVWREPGVLERIAQLDARLFAVHVSDWPHGEPRMPADRVLPGEGQIDLPAFLAACRRSGYDGAYCIELFSDQSLPDSLCNVDQERLLTSAVKSLTGVWEQSGRLL